MSTNRSVKPIACTFSVKNDIASTLLGKGGSDATEPIGMGGSEATKLVNSCPGW